MPSPARRGRDRHLRRPARELLPALRDRDARGRHPPVRHRRARPGHRACDGAGARPEPARLPHRLRRQPYLHARRHRRAGLRRRLQRAGACAGDPDARAAPAASTMRVSFEGSMPVGVTPKDLILRLIGEIGAAGGTGYAVEYAGSAVRALDVEGRLTICNLSIELGAKMGFVAPDETTFAYLAGRRFAPKGAPVGARRRRLAQAAERRRCAVRPRAHDRRGEHRAADHLGHQPGARDRRRPAHPRPRQIADPSRRGGMEAALDYMGLEARRADRRHQGRLGLHRLVHQQPPLRPARRGRRGARPQGGRGRARLGGAGLREREARRGGRRPGPHLPRGRLRMARARLLHVPCRQRRDRAAGPALASPPPTATSSAARARGARTHLASPAMAAAAAIAGAITDVRRMGS